MQAELVEALRANADILNRIALQQIASFSRVSETATRITSVDAAANYLQDMAHLPQEQFRVVFLDTKHRPNDQHIIYQGTNDGITIRPADVFRPAIIAAAAVVILAHNHPSGDPTPSNDDVVTTDRLISAGELLGVKVVDHLIIGSEGTVSFRQKGLGQWTA